MVAISINALATLAWARIRHGGPALGAFFRTGLRAALLAVPAAIGGAVVLTGRPGTLGALVDLALGGLVFALVAGVGVAVLGDAQTRDGVSRILRRLVGRRAST